MVRQQRTVARPGSVSGIGLHTGAECTLTLRPAPCDHGLKFKHKDLVIDAHISHVRHTQRQTALGSYEGTVFTIEHVLSALYGMDIDNALIEMTASEAPICDGSATAYVELIERCGVVEQGAIVPTMKLRRPIRIETGGSILVALPYDAFILAAPMSTARKA